MSPRLHGIRERVQRDHHFHFPTGDGGHVQLPLSDHTTILVDVAASSADVTITFGMGMWTDKLFGMGMWTDKLTVTGPWLTGRQSNITIYSMLEIASDAVQAGKPKSAMEVIAEILERPRAHSVLHPLVIPSRQSWNMTVRPNDGVVVHGPVDVWLRTLVSRDVA